MLNAGSLNVYLFRNLTYGDVCASVQEQSSEGSGPTHIVASITYGMNAIMIFEKVTGKCEKKVFKKLDPVGSTVRYKIMKLSTGSV